jgi:hypothetical protein
VRWGRGRAFPAPALSVRAMDALGRAVGRLILATGGGQVRRGPEGTLIFEQVRGPLVDLVQRAGGRLGLPAGTAAFALGHVIFNTGRFDESTEAGARWLAHEVGHVRQAEALGARYLPAYFLTLLRTGYAAHPMERAAIQFGQRHWERYWRPAGAACAPLGAQTLGANGTPPAAARGRSADGD